jgi:hypothetical protein
MVTRDHRSPGYMGDRPGAEHTLLREDRKNRDVLFIASRLV